MSVNRKIFGLATSLAVFAGMAYGQALTCNTAAAGFVSTSPTNPIELRSEGVTELVSDTITPCLGTAVAIQGNVTAFISGSGVQGITSKGLAGGISEATLQIVDVTAAHATVYYAGTVLGSQVTFGSSVAPVVFPTYNFTIQVSNVRVNVSGTYPNVPQAVTETVFAGTQGVASLFNPVALTVGYIRNGLAVTGSGTTYVGAGSAVAGTAAGDVSFPVCQGQTAVGFSVNVSELFAGAFKTQNTPVAESPYLLGGQPASANIPGSESGSLFTGSKFGVDTVAATAQAAGVGTATSGTRIKFVFSNIPANVSLSVPLTLVGNGFLAGGDGTTQWNLQLKLDSGTETGAFAAAASGTLSIAGGSATAIYEVTQATLTLIKSFTLPVTVTYASNAVLAPSGPIVVTTSYAPSPATPGASLPAVIPTIPYFANTGTPLNGATFAVCQTTLLFPFVTNQSGFETGIAIANTGLDNLGVGGKSVATGQAGACTINFYGSTGAEGGAQPTAPVAANFPSAANEPTTTIAPGATHADTLTDVLGGPFQGYAIAVCPFLYAKGFAFIEYGLATQNGVVEGYLADVINSNRTSSVAANAQVLSNFPESSGQ